VSSADSIVIWVKNHIVGQLCQFFHQGKTFRANFKQGIQLLLIILLAGQPQVRQGYGIKLSSASAM